MIQFVEVQNGFGVVAVSGIHRLKLGAIHDFTKSIGGANGNGITEHIVESLDENQNFAVDGFKIFFRELIQRTVFGNGMHQSPAQGQGIDFVQFQIQRVKFILHHALFLDTYSHCNFSFGIG